MGKRYAPLVQLVLIPQKSTHSGSRHPHLNVANADANSRSALAFDLVFPY